MSSFSSGEAALSAVVAGAGSIELLICDLQMPGMDGIELVRAIAAAGFSGSLALLSGEDTLILRTSERLARAHGLHVVGMHPKPIDRATLSEILAAARSRIGKSPRRVARVYGAEQLREAISGGQLVNHYQPKVNVSSGAVVGVESLVRWAHPTDGMVFPDEFIGIAEEHGLIDDLTNVVLGDALRQLSEWRRDGLDLSVAVNVSLDNLTSLAFPELVAGAARDAGVPITKLLLEVTESRLAKDPRAPLDVLGRLRLKRVGLSIDDFGTGHSSLSQLRDYPFEELKVDRGFVHGACRDRRLGAIFEASVRMARDLGMKVVAEGVEDRADWDFLGAMGCDMAQGYFIARPMAGADLAKWCSSWEARRPELVAEAT